MNKLSQTDLNIEKSENIDVNSKHLRPGVNCPRCMHAKLDYDSLLHLVCPNCGFTETGAST